MTKMTWHINRRAMSSRECSMYWSSRLCSVHCTMTLMSTRCGFPTPKTLYKPLPPPLKYPYPWKGYGFASGKGKGRCKNTCGLPMPITTPDAPYIHLGFILKSQLPVPWNTTPSTISLSFKWRFVRGDWTNSLSHHLKGNRWRVSGISTYTQSKMTAIGLLTQCC